MLIDKIKSNRIDVVFITGDLIDSRNTNISTVLDFIDGIKDIVDIYYVSGNHESRIDEYEDLINSLKNRDVFILDNDLDYIEKDNSKINIIGLQDPAFYDSNGYQIMGKTLSLLTKKIDNDSCNILLSHRPESFPIYRENEIDLIFSGHTHGGQIRIPIIGGIYAPNQGFFPKYLSGVYKEGKSTMVISKGLGNSVIPLRTFNRPEILIVELKGE